MPGLYIGLMSGTSLDGVDGVLAQLSDAPFSAQVLLRGSLDMPAALRAELLALNTPGPNEIHRAALAANALVRLYAQLVKDLLLSAQVSASQVHAIGAHGQTVRHQPGVVDGVGYTVQLNQAALLAELTGIDVVADFRSRDVAAGGQGAPLVPPFHQVAFGDVTEGRAVLNIGGISNITFLPASAQSTDSAGLLGFDCGPGNALMDAWCEQHTGHRYDAQGLWAAQGQVHAGLLEALLNEAFFDQKPPKSTGRDLFNRKWLERKLAAFAPIAPVDVQATLTDLTAQACARSMQWAPQPCMRWLVCGGGARNVHLMHCLQKRLPQVNLSTTQVLGIAPQDVEALAFAWLGQQALRARAASLPSVTGARGARILGAIYRA
jgi:anhydro-N-acetylmuramic acid kinase